MGKNNPTTKSVSDSPLKPKKSPTIVNFFKKLRNSKKSIDKKIENSNKVKLKNYDVDDKIMSVRSSRINSSRARQNKIDSKKKVVNNIDDIFNNDDIQNTNNEKSTADCVVDVDKKIIKENVVVSEKFINKSSRIPRPRKSGLLVSKRISRLYLSTKSNRLSVKSGKRASKQSVATNARTPQVDVRLQTSNEKLSSINNSVVINPEINSASLLVIPESKKASKTRLCDDHLSLKNSTPPRMPKSLSWPMKEYSSPRRVKNRWRKFSSSSSDDELSSSMDSDYSPDDNYRSSIVNSSSSKIKQKDQHLIHSFFNTLFDIVFWPLLFTRSNRKK